MSTGKKGNRFYKGINDIYTMRPDIAKLMYNYNRFYDITVGNNPQSIHIGNNSHTIFCRCENGHEFSTTASLIDRWVLIDGKIPCKECIKSGLLKDTRHKNNVWNNRKRVGEEGYKLPSNAESFLSFCSRTPKYKYLLDEWDYSKNDKLGIHVDNIPKASTKEVHWKCKDGHTFIASPYYVISKNLRCACPYCGNRKLLVGFNDVLSNYPEIREFWDYEHNKLGPENYMISSYDEVYFNLPEGKAELKTIHSVLDRILRIREKEKNIKLEKRVNLAEFRPDLIRFWDYEKNGSLTPYNAYPSSHSYAWTKCVACGKSQYRMLKIISATSGLCEECASKIQNFNVRYQRTL